MPNEKKKTKKRSEKSNSLRPIKEKAAIGEIYEPTGETLENGFNRVWGGHRFLDEEVSMLLAGEELKVLTQKEKIVIGRLEKGEFKGKEFWGFQIGIPQKTAGHEWTAEEREELYQGEELYIEDFYSPKTCDYFEATAYWDEAERDMVLVFDDGEDEEEEDDEEE
ncbi:MAG: DUF3945 domain-containing protein [Bacillota bacterium]|nr:DUF3945 domain-containing protein [Bacillota bacterium]